MNQMGGDKNTNTLPQLSIPNGVNGTVQMVGAERIVTPTPLDPALIQFQRPPPATVPLGWAEPTGLTEAQENKIKQETLQVSKQ